jgi:hypothetical protein
MVAGKATGLRPEKLAGSLSVSSRISIGRAGFARASDDVRGFHPEFGISLLTGKSTVDHAPPDCQIRDEAQLFADAPMRRPSQLATLRIPEPQFPTRTPAGRRPSRPVPVRASAGQPDPSDRAGRPGVEQLRWARCPDDGRLHLLQPVGVDLAAASGHAQAVCGHRVPAQGLTINGVPSGALCMACVIGATS